jgi:ureidoglycolate hydrolase
VARTTSGGKELNCCQQQEQRLNRVAAPLRHNEQIRPFPIHPVDRSTQAVSLQLPVTEEPLLVIVAPAL